MKSNPWSIHTSIEQMEKSYFGEATSMVQERKLLRRGGKDTDYVCICVQMSGEDALGRGAMEGRPEVDAKRESGRLGTKHAERRRQLVTGLIQRGCSRGSNAFKGMIELYTRMRNGHAT